MIFSSSQSGGSGGGPVSYGNLGNPDPAGDEDTEMAPDRPTRLYMAKYNQSVNYNEQVQESMQDSPGNVSVQNYQQQQWTVNWSDTGPDTWGSGSVNEPENADGGTQSGTCGGGPWSQSDTTTISWPSGIEVDTVNGGPPTTTYNVSPDGFLESVHCQAGAGPQDNYNTTEWEWLYFGACAEPPAVSSSYQENENCQRSEDATWMLETGGKGVPGQENLWQISGSASDIPVGADTLYGYPWEYYEYGLPTTPIPPQDITIMGLPLDANGNLWVALPDGVSKDVTPKANGHDFYTFGVGANEYLLYIQANGVTLDPSTVVNGAQFCVGQYIYFNPTFTAASLGAQSTFPRWAFGGTFVNTNVPPQYPDGCPDYYVENSAYLQGETTYAWWVSGGYSPVTYTAQFGEGLTFPNGRYVVVTAKGLFNMHRPRLVNYNLLSGPSTGTLAHEHTYDTIPNDILGYIGRTPPNYNAPSYTMDVDSKYDGLAFITQLVNGYETNASIGVNTQGANELDNDEPYLYPQQYYGVHAGVPTNSQVALIDVPTIPCYLTTAQNLYFTDYIRFEPTGGIPVPLGIVTWNVIDATSLNTNADDYIPVLPSSATNSANIPYFLPTGTGHTDSSPSDSEMFPYWVHTAKNQQN